MHHPTTTPPTKHPLRSFDTSAQTHSLLLTPPPQHPHTHTVPSCSWAFSMIPRVGWGDSPTAAARPQGGTSQKATAGWLSMLSVFEPHWQVCACWIFLDCQAVVSVCPSVPFPAYLLARLLPLNATAQHSLLHLISIQLSKQVLMVHWGEQRYQISDTHPLSLAHSLLLTVTLCHTCTNRC